jgi:hypothetical protein
MRLRITLLFVVACLLFVLVVDTQVSAASPQKESLAEVIRRKEIEYGACIVCCVVVVVVVVVVGYVCVVVGWGVFFFFFFVFFFLFAKVALLVIVVGSVCAYMADSLSLSRL